MGLLSKTAQNIRQLRQFILQIPKDGDNISPKIMVDGKKVL